MATTQKQDRDFALALFDSKLEEAIDWIRDNLDPSDVFSDKVLEEWAEKEEDR